MRYYPARFTRDQVEGWIQWSLQNYADFGYSLWAVVLKGSQRCIGDCGLTWQRVGYSEDRQLEVGWHIRRDLWNRGLATEAGLACRDYARDVIRQPHLISIIDPHNLASPAVARKLGMELEHEDVVTDTSGWYSGWPSRRSNNRTRRPGALRAGSVGARRPSPASPCRQPPARVAKRLWR